MSTLRNAEEARRWTERWTSFLYGDLDPEETEAFEAECLQDADACEELYRELNVDAALSTVRSESLVSRPPSRSGLRRRLLNLAVVGGLGLSAAGIAWWTGTGGAPSLPRDDSRCRPLEPRGAQGVFPDRFVWTRESGAHAYRFELRGEDGSVLLETTVVDTVLFFPPDRRPPSPSGSWSWRVHPEGPGTKPSESASFRVAG